MTAEETRAAELDSFCRNMMDKYNQEMEANGSIERALVFWQKVRPIESLASVLKEQAKLAQQKASSVNASAPSDSPSDGSKAS